MAFNKEWRHTAMALLPPGERMGAIALDALLGQTGEGDKWSQGWVTEVISPGAFEGDGLGTLALAVLRHAPGTLRGYEPMDRGESLDRIAPAIR